MAEMPYVIVTDTRKVATNDTADADDRPDVVNGPGAGLRVRFVPLAREMTFADNGEAQTIDDIIGYYNGAAVLCRYPIKDVNGDTTGYGPPGASLPDLTSDVWVAPFNPEQASWTVLFEGFVLPNAGIYVPRGGNIAPGLNDNYDLGRLLPAAVVNGVPVVQGRRGIGIEDFEQTAIDKARAVLEDGTVGSEITLPPGAPGGSDTSFGQFLGSEGTETNTAGKDLVDKRATVAYRTADLAPGGSSSQRTKLQAWLNKAGAAVTSGLTQAVAVSVPHAPEPYNIDGPLTIPSGVSLLGEGAATLKLTASATRFLDLNNKSGVTVSIGIDFNGLITNSGIRAGVGSVDVTVARSRLTSSAALPNGVFPVNVEGGALRTNIDDNLFVGLTRCVRVYTDNAFTRVARNHFRDWGERAVFVLGTATAAATDLTISDNEITDVTQNAVTRQPIAIQFVSGAVHKRVWVRRNRIVGNLLAHHITTSPSDPENGTEAGGTADAISLHGCDNFAIEQNSIYGSGEVGVTVSRTCSWGRVAANLIDMSNSNGIAVGAAGTTVTDVSVVDNLLRNNGREVGCQNGPRTGTQAGIWCKSMTGGEIRGNMAYDDQGTPTQLAVMYLSNNTDVEIGLNRRRGGTTLVTHAASSGNVGLRFDVPPRIVVKGTNEARSSGGTNYADTPVDTTLTVPVEVGGIYDVRVELHYSGGSTTGDIQVGFACPAASTMAWRADGAASNATTVNATTPRTLYNQASLAPLGTATTNMAASLVGRITVGTTGVIALKWSQLTTDAANPTTLLASTQFIVQRVG